MKYVGYIFASIILIFFAWLAWAFVTNIAASEPSVKAGLIGAFGVSIGAIITHHLAKKREINARHFADKREGYIQVINLLSDMLMGEKSGKQLSEDEIVEKLLTFKKSILVWGSPELLEVWNDYELKAGSTTDPKEMVRQLESILRAIRKDLGHDDTRLKFGSLWGLFLNAEAKKELLEENKI